VLRIVSDGINYACGLTLAGLILSYFFNPYLGIPLYVVALFCLWFFRDPDRTIPSGDVMLAPADGKIVSIKSLPAQQTRLSIFLNIVNVHVTRAPVSGLIRDVTYTKGKFRVASFEEASVENERSTFQIEAGDSSVTFSMIAGLIARRIVSYKRAGDTVEAGERIGLMKFGSRVDIFFGPEWKLLVSKGLNVKAGVSILAHRTPAEEHL
jgi:phosphatidylserine decarboxylase